MKNTFAIQFIENGKIRLSLPILFHRKTLIHSAYISLRLKDRKDNAIRLATFDPPVVVKPAKNDQGAL